jgi:hypothetical protein
MIPPVLHGPYTTHAYVKQLRRSYGKYHRKQYGARGALYITPLLSHFGRKVVACLSLWLAGQQTKQARQEAELACCSAAPSMQICL